MIRTWMADVTSLLEEKQYCKYYDHVPKFRQEKAEKLRFANDRALSVGAWVLYEKMREAYNLSEHAPFNLSHSGSCVLCSVEDAGDVSVKVGCDLEEIKEERLKIAKRFFCEEEYKYILENEGSFYRYWVLKESFIKATRYGLQMGLNEFEIRYMSPNEPVLCKQPDYIEGQYYFKEYDVGELPYRVAVCANQNNFAGELCMIKL